MPLAPTTRRNPWLWIPTLYMAEGVPYVVVMMVSVILYKNLGLSNTDIALYTSWLYLPFVIKPLWSPVVDLLKTRRQWVWVMELIVGAALASVALTIPTTEFFRWTLVCFWLLAFSGATHDVAADGFYLLGTTEREQAFFIGIRGGFFNISKVAAQGLLVMLTGAIQNASGLAPVVITVSVLPADSAVRAPGWVAPTDFAMPGGGPLRLVASTNQVAIAAISRTPAEAQAVIGAARAWNVEHGFSARIAEAKERAPSWWSRTVSEPFGNGLKQRFGPKSAGTKTDTAGNLGISYVRLTSKPMRDLTATLWLVSGDKSIGPVEGARLEFTSQNWDQPAAVVFQLDPKLRSPSVAAYELRSGNIPLSWVVCFGVLAVLMVLFGVYHCFRLPRPESDRPGKAGSLGHFFEEFFRTFGAFFRKNGIGMSLCFLMFYRFAESQLVKMVAPFLLDPLEAGGLGLTTSQVGFAYGTVGIIALMSGGVLGGFAISRHGLRAWLWPMALIMHLPDAIFVYLAYAQPSGLALISACVGIEQFGYGFGFVAYMFYMICIARGPHATAHFAICTGFMALGMMVPGMWSGWLQECVGYQHFFLWVMLATIPGFVVVGLVKVDAGFGRKSETA